MCWHHNDQPGFPINQGRIDPTPPPIGIAYGNTSESALTQSLSGARSLTEFLLRCFFKYQSSSFQTSQRNSVQVTCFASQKSHYYNLLNLFLSLPSFRTFRWFPRLSMNRQAVEVRGCADFAEIARHGLGTSKVHGEALKPQGKSCLTIDSQQTIVKPSLTID